MTEQKNRILESSKYIYAKSPFKKATSLALVTYKDPYFLKEFNVLKKIKYSDIPPNSQKEEKSNQGEFLFAKLKKSNSNLYILNGRYNFYNGYEMRDISHPIYVLKELGVKTIIFVDEVGHLNPRFSVGGVAFIYDHINLMGDNPLIGENDDSLGPRFPDMSNAYDEYLFKRIENIFIQNKFRYYSSVYLGLIGPESETEAECRFYREIGADILGYSIVPENLAAVHGSLKSIGFGMISRELVADRLKEISEEEQSNNRLKSEKYFSKIIREIINNL